MAINTNYNIRINDNSTISTRTKCILGVVGLVALLCLMIYAGQWSSGGEKALNVKGSLPLTTLLPSTGLFILIMVASAVVVLGIGGCIGAAAGGRGDDEA